LAFFVALLWTVHPLQTECVTYVIQRAESLMGLFYLLTLYCFVRSTEYRRQETGVRSQDIGDLRSEGGSVTSSALQSFSFSAFRWRLASALCCLLGAACKEVMVSAPLMVLLYDRTFVAGSFRAAWRQRRKYYFTLAGTWLLLGYLVIATGGRGTSAGFGLKVPWWSYALTQFRAIVRYLRLSFWPHPLVFYYGTTLATRPAEIIPYALIVLLLAIGTVFALWRRPAIGFLGCWFFAILAPSSSIVPVVTETMSEHRMYLALAPVIVLVVLGLYSWLGRRSIVIFPVLALGLGGMTVQRNNNYKSEVALWSDTVAKWPDNPHAFYNLGYAFERTPGRSSEAIVAYQTAVRIDPDIPEAHNNLGTLLLKIPGRLTDAIAQFQAALRAKPDYEEAHYNLANALSAIPNRLPEAIAQYEAALRIDPNSAPAHYNYGTALLKIPGRLADAMTQFQMALRIDPDSVEAHNNLGNALFNLPGRMPDAIAQYEAALRIRPDSVETHYNLANALLKTPGRLPDAITQLKITLQLKPDLKLAQDLLEQLQHPTTNVER
jgi:tetratricopeptide (TPR) repeat protein